MSSFSQSLTGPVQHAYIITPSDTANVARTTRGLYVGTSGDLRVELAGDQGGAIVVLKGLAAGVIHPLGVRRVYATGTAAADIVGLY